MTKVTRARVLLCIDGQTHTLELPIASLIDALEFRGHRLTAINRNPHQRAELQGQPKFEGLVGPMWDGDGIRYECPETYKLLSC